MSAGVDIPVTYGDPRIPGDLVWVADFGARKEGLMPSIVIFGLSETGAYFPLRTIDLEALRQPGFTDQFMLEVSGQISQLNVEPSGPRVSTPQVDDPEQPLNTGGYGGNPGLVGRNEVEIVTVVFATGQSKVLSAT